MSKIKPNNSYILVVLIDDHLQIHKIVQDVLSTISDIKLVGRMGQANIKVIL